MACGCDTYGCLDVFVNPCNEWTYIGITAAETGQWLMRIEFNNAWSEFGIEVATGEQVAVPTSTLNESYVHELWIFNISGIRTCYKLKTKYSKGVEGAPVPPGFTDKWNYGTVTANGNTVTSALFTGEVTSIIYLNGAPTLMSDSDITIDSETGVMDLTNIGGYVGTINFWYRNIVA